MPENKTRTYAALNAESQCYANEGVELSRLAVSDEEQLILEKGLTHGIKDSNAQGVKTAGTQVRFRLVSLTQVIPQFGVAGEAGDGWLRIDLDKTRIHDPDFSDGVARLTTHELNHVERTRDGAILIRTLGDALISEGMAQFAEMKAGHAPADYSVFRSQEEMDAFAAEASKHLNDVIIGRENPGFGKWFFGCPGEDGTKLPIYGGYALGTAIVKAYCQKNGLGVSEATHLPAEKILNAWTCGALELKQDASHSVPSRGIAHKALPPNYALQK